MNKKYVALIFILSFLYVPCVQTITYIQNMSQVWGLSVQNKAQIPIVVKDEIFYPIDRKEKITIVNPGSIYHAQMVTALGRDYKNRESKDKPWVLTSQPNQGRLLTIWGICRGTVEPTNVITIGNVEGATYQAISSGTYTITNLGNSRCAIAVANPIDTTHPR